ncbi:MAG: hypothetical protein J6A99_05165 [Clostridia bacterium]|nr:hypothetical protein [Clostridia bacterium]
MKNTKRSMIITTVLMVVVLVVAISTSTFAWYTAASNGTASEAHLVAANSSSANIALGWTATSTATSITFDATEKQINPAAPAVAGVIGETAFADYKLYTSTLSASNKFNGNGTETEAWTVKENGGDATSFYVINNNQNAGTTVTMTINYAADVADDPATDDVDETVTYSNNNKLVVAVFVDGKYAGIFCNTGNGYACGSIVSDADANTVTKNETVDTQITFSLGAKVADSTNYAVITVKAWLDGIELNQDYANQKAAFSFTFQGSDAAI